MNYYNGKVFTFIWRIENFSYCSKSYDQKIRSPVFLVKRFNFHAHLSLCPLENGSMHLDLHSTAKYRGPKTFLEYEGSLLGADTLPEIKMLSGPLAIRIPPGVQHRFVLFITRDALQRNRNKLLPQDTLTIRFRIWNCLSNGRRTGLDDLDQVFAQTHIRVAKMPLVWYVDNFSDLVSYEKRVMSVTSVSQEFPSFSFTLFLTSSNVFCKNSVQIEIRRFDDERPNFVTCKIFVLDIEGREVNAMQDEHWFECDEGNKPWIFRHSLTKNYIMSKKERYLHENTLRLVCELVVSIGDEHVRSTNGPAADAAGDRPTTLRDNDPTATLRIDKRHSGLDESNLVENFEFMHKTGLSADFTLRTGGETFPVHKSILSDMSPEFRTMFVSRINLTGVADISDVLDADTLRRMLRYMYTGFVDNDLDWNSASKLYDAGGKYRIAALELVCSSFLQSNLSRSNVFDALLLADMHEDVELRAAAENFICSQDSSIIETKEWKEFEKHNHYMVREFLRQICLRKK